MWRKVACTLGLTIMANTNAPKVSTQGTAFIPAFGDDTISVNASSTQTFAKFSMVDCVPTFVRNVGKDPMYSVMPRPPILFRTGQAIGLTAIALARGDDTANSYVLNSDGTIYQVQPASGVYTLFNTISTAGPYTYASGLQFVIAGIRYMAFLVSVGVATDLHIYNLTSGGAATVVNLAAAGALRDLEFLDGYLFAHNGSYIYNSKVGDPDNWALTVDFTAAEMIGDDITGLAVHRNHLVVFGTNSIEFFYNASIEIGSPMKRQAAYAATSIGKAERINISDTAQIEERIYFTALVDGVELLALIDNFKVRLLNDGVTVKQTGSTLANQSLIPIPQSVTSINVIRLYGNAAVLWAGPLDHYVYFPDSNSWSLFKIKDHNGIGRLIRWVLTISGKTNAIFFDGLPGAVTYGTMTHNAIVETDAVAVDPTPEWYSQVLDFGNYNKKLLKWVDAIGTFGQWTMQMSISLDEGRKDQWITTGESKNQNDAAFSGEIFPVRWRINQPVRRFVVRMQFTPTGSTATDAPFNFEKLALDFNQYTL